MALSVKLKPVGGGKESVISSGPEVIIGRGPLFEITDKRVSRNHASIVVDDKGVLQLTSNHANPCFYKAGGKGKVALVSKGETKALADGDVFSLLPDALTYQVVYPEKSSDSSKAGNGLTSPAKSEGDDWDAVSAAVLKDVEESPEKILPAKKKPTPVKPDLPMALPLDKERKLPAWMMGASSRVVDDPPPKGKGKGRGKARPPKPPPPAPKRAAVKKGYDLSDSGGEDEGVGKTAKATPKMTPPKPKAKGAKEADTGTARGAGRTSRKSYAEMSDSEPEAAPTTTKRRKKAMSDSDSEFDAADGSDSDWGTTRPKSKKGGGKSPTKAVTPSKKKKKQDDLSDSDFETYTPRATKTRGASIDDKTPTKGASKVKKAGKRAPCPYGAKCYRKNPGHREEESHPGDSDYASDHASSDAADAGDSDEDDRPECEFGVDCYRKNPAHRKEYKHTKKAGGRPTRKAALRTKDKRSVLHGASDDESVPNTYDYNDSFLDDAEVSGSSSSYSDPGDSDEDYDPGEDAEDVNALVKEAKAFKKNKKMMK